MKSSEDWNLILTGMGSVTIRYNIEKHELGTMWMVSGEAEIPGKMLRP